MCEPTTIAMASLALGAVSTYSAYDQGKKNTEAQNAMNKRNYDAAMQSYRDNHGELQYQNQQEWGASQAQATEISKETRQVESRARVAAGESGIMGTSVDALLREIGGQGAGNQANIYANYLSTNRQLGSEMRNVRNHTATTVSGLGAVRGPSGLAAGLRIGSQAVDTYSNYKAGKYGT